MYLGSEAEQTSTPPRGPLPSLRRQTGAEGIEKSAITRPTVIEPAHAGCYFPTTDSTFDAFNR